jgi:hypothetical protein
VEFETPLYLLRAGGAPLIAFSLGELLELLDCAARAGDEVDLVHVYYGAGDELGYADLTRIISILAER